MMDELWMIILNVVRYVQGGLDTLFAPLHTLGPVVTVTTIAVLTAAAAKLFSRFRTPRYRELEKEFNYWYEVKQEALRVKDSDPEKAKELGRNIDQAKLNKAYYDFFLEGFLNNLLTRILPIFIMLGYVNATYQPQALESLFGRNHLFMLPWFDGNHYEIGAVFWFVFCVFGFFIVSFIAGLIIRRKRNREKPRENDASPAEA
ncbi:MAG: hypothetical protein ACLFRO_07550 [Desulfobacterales bacterium]